MEIASWQAPEEKWNWPSKMCIHLNPQRDHLFQMEKQKNPTLYWEWPRTLGVGLVQIPLWKDQTYSSYFKMILTPDYKIRLLWLVPKARLRCFRLPFVSTGCGIASFIEKSNTFPGYRLSTHRNGPLLTWITWLNIPSLHKRWPKFWNWRRNLISNQMLAIKNFKNWKLWGRHLTRSHKSQHFLLNFEVWR